MAPAIHAPSIARWMRRATGRMRKARAGISAISAPTVPTGSLRSNGCCSPRRAVRARWRPTTSVAGPQYPEDIDWPDNVERIEHLPPSGHAGFYGAQRFTLNITRADMIEAGWSPSVRLFEAASCGTPIISDRWAGLDELLPDGEAIIIADTGDDVMRALLSLGEENRREIAARAMTIVHAGHTGAARARELERLLVTARR